MKLNQHQLELIFQNNFEFQGRTKKNLLKDEIYQGMFKDTLISKGVNLSAIHKAEKSNLLKKHYFKPDSDVSMGYLYVGRELGRNKLKYLLKDLWLKLKNLV